MLNFNIQLAKWKQSNSQEMAGKALLLYQKYIKPMSFLDMNIPEELRMDIEEVLLNEDALVEATISQDFFDKVENYVRDKLESPLREFRHSAEYTRVLASILEGGRLMTGMKQAGINV